MQAQPRLARFAERAGDHRAVSAYSSTSSYAGEGLLRRVSFESEDLAGVEGLVAPGSSPRCCAIARRA